MTDVIFRAFEACAASQGDCNNLTFGFGGNVLGEEETKGFGYYETIAGGSGAVSTYSFFLLAVSMSPTSPPFFQFEIRSPTQSFTFDSDSSLN